jgi:hypothetical protein
MVDIDIPLKDSRRRRM